jgi:molecular chaperone GrpE (heat shock protein)
VKNWLAVVLGALAGGAVAFAVVSSGPPDPGSSGSGTSTVTGSTATLEREVRSLRDRVESQEARIERLVAELDLLRRLDPVVSSDEPGMPEEHGAGAAPAEEAPPPPPADDRTEEEIRGEKIAQARKATQDGLRQLLDASEDYEKRRAERVKQEARRLGERFALPDETTRAVAQALWESSQRMSALFRSELSGRDLAALTRETMRPLIVKMFEDRYRSVQPHLTPEQLKAFMNAEAEKRKRYGEWLRVAFPSERD